MKKLIRTIAATTALAVTTAGCGYILHPERRGNNGGAIDGTDLVFDILWLIPGIIPGVVALVLDFGSGAIYVGGGRGIALKLTPQGNLALALPDSKKPMTLEFRLVTESHRVVADKTAVIGPDIHGGSVLLETGDALRGNHEKLFLEVLDANHGAARLQTPIAVL